MTGDAPASSAAAASSDVRSLSSVDHLLENLPYASELSQVERRELLGELSRQLEVPLVPAWIPSWIIRVVGVGLTTIIVLSMLALSVGGLFSLLIAGTVGMFSYLATVRGPIALLRSRRMSGPRAALAKLFDEGRLTPHQRAGVEALLEEFNRAN